MKLFSFFVVTLAERTRRNVSSRSRTPLETSVLGVRASGSCRDFNLPQSCCEGSGDEECASGSCWCDSICCDYGDCCHDYDQGQCAAQLGSCAVQTGEADYLDCEDGFYYDVALGGCTDIDECADGSYSCEASKVCNNTEGGYTCECPSAENNGVCLKTTTCVEDTQFGDLIATEINSAEDKPAPESIFDLKVEDFDGDAEDCQRECASYAGCYKERFLVMSDIKPNRCIKLIGVHKKR